MHTHKTQTHSNIQRTETLLHRSLSPVQLPWNEWTQTHTGFMEQWQCSNSFHTNLKTLACTQSFLKYGFRCRTGWKWFPISPHYVCVIYAFRMKAFPSSCKHSSLTDWLYCYQKARDLWGNTEQCPRQQAASYCKQAHSRGVVLHLNWKTAASLVLIFS